jgi:tripartite-type tricarboxylate transporter receptor subunit TctC
MNRCKMMAGIVSLFSICLFASQVWGAEAFPTKRFELVNPYAAGGSTDVMCRTIAARATPFLNNQPCVVVNKVGGGTVIGSKYVLMEGHNDGYILFSSSTSSVMIAPVINKAGFSWKDFTGICQTMLGSDAFFVRADGPFTNLQKFIEYAKQNPGKVKFSSSGTGTSPHLGGEGLAAVKGISIKHIPTKGDSEALAALLGGHVMAASMNPLAALPHVAAGKLRCLAQYGAERDKAVMPNVPTYKEQGVDVVLDLWRWIVVPKGTDPERVKFLREAFRKIFQDKETLSALEKIQCPASYLPGEEYEKRMMKSEAAVIPLIKAAGL